MLKVRDLRGSFLQFFKDRDHKIIPSSSLIPKDDPTLLFTTAGMVQFKPMFAGTVKLDYTRASTVQKCLRTSDLERVGKTKRHCTFFEMLGNFSFGDYFKKEAIEFAWDYSTQIIGFPREDIWISIYEDDDEAFGLWHGNIGVPAEKIVRLGREDNFWGPAGDSGACGPCSELYLDRGPAYGCGSPDYKPGCDCERFLEFWNLVFNQYNQDVSGKLTPLPRTGIDTGMGLERLATLVQKVDSIYETDELRGLVDYVCRETGRLYEGDNIAPVNVMVEHARALTFAISDGVYPSNEGRGYVLRRILRRALRFGRFLGITKPFLYNMTDQVVAVAGEHYPEIVKAHKNVKNVLEGEENRFLETLENGMDRLEEIMKGLKKGGGDMMSGRDAFLLYDTFGFPLEMTVEIASEQNLRVDMAEFESEMEKQRERGKQSWKSAEKALEGVMEEISGEAGETPFRGYEEDVIETRVKFLADDKVPVKELKAGDQGILVAEETTFYGEAGGQVGDRGRIVSGNGAVFIVEATKKINKTILHAGRVLDGVFHTGDAVRTEFDVVNRNLIRANHTATHLLQAALRHTLGDHVHQSGSLVEAERMRFDFTHFKALNDEEIDEIERIVNNRIWESIPVETSRMKLEEALKTGAMAVFDEKYEEDVRVVRVGNVSMELCGGTHVDNTGKIGVFKILREVSPGAGIRRIEAITLKGIYDRYSHNSRVIHDLTRLLNASEGDLFKKIEDIVEKAGRLEKEIEKMKIDSLSSNLDAILGQAVLHNGVKIISHQFDGASVDDLRNLSDRIRSREADSVVLFGSREEGKAMLLFAATKNAVSRGADCGGLIKEVSRIVGGGGGGRKDMAQAGGKSPEGLDRALAEAVKAAQRMIQP